MQAEVEADIIEADETAGYTDAAAVAGSGTTETGNAKIADVRVNGQAFELPEDLYIPPDALRIFLEAFQGPLDLLLYLIKRQNIDIINIPIARITQQYMEYVEMMRGLRFELAAEYLVMAATLAEIKSRILLPRPVSEEGEEDDPRAELVRRLQEYEVFKKAAQDLDTLPRQDRDVFNVYVDASDLPIEKPLPQVELDELVLALKDVFKRMKLNAHHHVKLETLSVRERMTQVLAKIQHKKFSEFTQLFESKEGRLGVVVTFLAILELLRESLIEITQNEPFSPIHITTVNA